MSRSDWLTLPNPFPLTTESFDVIAGHVSGRRADIVEIVVGGQSAIILAGAPNIGKSTLIRYLQCLATDEWSWRNELQDYRTQLSLDEVQFLQINLTPLEGIEQKEKLFSAFVEQCIFAFCRAYQRDQPSALDLKGLRELLRGVMSDTPNTRSFLILDSIERLGLPGMPSYPLNTVAQTPQERGIALLDHSNAIRTLVDLVDEFAFFGVIISIASLPRPKIDDQFTHVSADLARFTTMTLQIFAHSDAAGLIAQEPEDFGTTWASRFKALGSKNIFSRAEQDWLLEQAGTHPYLLQQFCFHTFRLKQERANRNGTWSELREDDKIQLIDLIDVRLNTFLNRTWQRLQEAVEISKLETKNQLDRFLHLLSQNRDAIEQIELTDQNHFGAELRYILYNEGVVRYDPFDPTQSTSLPGLTLSRYLVRKAKESSEQSSISAVLPVTSRELRIIRPDVQEEILPLTELEYRLLKVLLQYPNRATEEDLIKRTWGNVVGKSAFTQRMYQLRKKLEKACKEEIIENQYGGYYSLNNPGWFYLD